MMHINMLLFKPEHLCCVRCGSAMFVIVVVGICLVLAQTLIRLSMESLGG